MEDLSRGADVHFRPVFRGHNTYFSEDLPNGRLANPQFKEPHYSLGHLLGSSGPIAHRRDRNSLANDQEGILVCRPPILRPRRRITLRLHRDGSVAAPSPVGKTELIPLSCKMGVPQRKIVKISSPDPYVDPPQAWFFTRTDMSMVTPSRQSPIDTIVDWRALRPITRCLNTGRRLASRG